MVIALAGRRIDAPNAATPSFPEANINEVKARLRTFFTSRKVSTLVCSAACGADLAALEVAATLGIHRVVILPFAPEIFRETSVTDRPGNWGPVYDKLMHEVQPIVLNYSKDDADAYTNTNLLILDHAKQKNDQSEALVVWNQKPRSSGDASLHFMHEAKKRNMHVNEISTLL